MQPHSKPNVQFDGVNFIVDGESLSFYDLLGISEARSITQKELLKKYKTQALKYHPDRRNGDEELFKALNQAFSTLRDEESRRQYDMDREEAGNGNVRLAEAIGSLSVGKLPSDTAREKMLARLEEYRRLAARPQQTNYFDIGQVILEITAALDECEIDSFASQNSEEIQREQVVDSNLKAFLQPFWVQTMDDIIAFLYQTFELDSSTNVRRAATSDETLLEEASAAFARGSFDTMIDCFLKASNYVKAIKAVEKILRCNLKTVPIEIQEHLAGSAKSAIHRILFELSCRCVAGRDLTSLCRCLALLVSMNDGQDRNFVFTIASFMMKNDDDFSTLAQRAYASVLMSLSQISFLMCANCMTETIRIRQQLKWYPVIVDACIIVEKLIENSVIACKLNGSVWSLLDTENLYTEHISLRLRRSFYECDFESIAELVYEAQAPEFIENFDEWLCEKLSTFVANDMVAIDDESPAQFQAFRLFVDALLARCGHDLDFAGELLMESLVKCPFDTVGKVVSFVLEKDEVLYHALYEKHILKFLSNLDFESSQVPSSDFLYQHWFRRAAGQIRIVRQFEKGILQEIDNPFERALYYLNLRPACDSVSAQVIANVLSAQWMVESMKTEDDPAELFARQEFVTSTCFGLFLVLRRGVLSLPCRITCLKAIFGIMFECIKLCHDRVLNFNEINFDAQIWKILCQTIVYLGRCCPTVSFSVLTTCDSLYLDLVSRKCCLEFLGKRKARLIENNLLCNPIDAEYFMFESVWRLWGNIDTDDDEDNKDDDEKKTEAELQREAEQKRNFARNKLFYETRFRLMESLLAEQNWSVANVEAVLSWRLLPRTSDGFLDTSTNTIPMQFSHSDGVLYKSVEGVNFNLETGHVELLLTQAQSPNEALFSRKDVTEVLTNGILGASFSLDPPENIGNRCMNYHPCQFMRCLPGGFAQTDHIQTMFHADYILKMITQGTEISAEKPFKEKNAFKDGFMKVLPKWISNELNLSYLREYTNERTVSDVSGQAHRFWIDTSDVEYTQLLSGNMLTYKIGNPQMCVKKHLLKKNLDGSLEDDVKNDDDTGLEAVFAENFTFFYDTLAEYFSVFGRLRELAKLSTMYQIIFSRYKSAKSALNEVRDDGRIADMKSSISSMRTNVLGSLPCWPLINHATTLMNETLAANNTTRERVLPAELTRVQNEINASLNRQQNELVDDIARNLSNSSGAPVSSVKPNVYGWLCGDSHQQHLIASAMSAAAAQKERVRLGRIVNYATSTLRINTNPEQTSESRGCLWVPAVFSDTMLVARQGRELRQVYGGVRLVPNLRLVYMFMPVDAQIKEMFRLGNEWIVKFVTSARFKNFGRDSELMSFEKTMALRDSSVGTAPTILSERGSNFIKGFEKFVPTTYLCQSNVPTIGWGHTGKDVKCGMTITKAQAQELFRKDVSRFENVVRENVKVDLTQNQFDALTSLAFNIGCDAFKTSTLLRKLNQGKYQDAADEFLVWRLSKGKVSNGLVRRRKEERKIFLEGMPSSGDGK